MCALGNLGVKCWGSNGSGQTAVPELKNPSMIATGDWHTCALDDEGVKCWGNSSYGLSRPPRMENPTGIWAGGDTSCARADSGLVCWGYNAYGQNAVPALQNVTSVGVGYYFSCAIDSGNLRCWGSRDDLPSFQPALRNPRTVSVNRTDICVSDDDGIKCWNKYRQYNHVPYVLESSWLFASQAQGTACAIGRNSSNCWYSNGQLAPLPQVQDARQAVMGPYHTCVMGKSGVKCMGSNFFGLLDTPPEYTVP
jgi:hypothetical protein